MLVVQPEQNFSVLHPPCAVMSWLVPSLKSAGAANCCCVNCAIDGDGGVITRPTTTAASTVTFVEPVMLLQVACTVVVPRSTALSRPLVEIVATVDEPVAHVALALPS